MADPTSQPELVTQLLEGCARGEEQAFEQLLPVVYDELHRLASKQLRRERKDHTLQTTALVHEAWLKLVGQEQRAWANRHHFLAIAAMAMRRVLLKHAAKKQALKRGGDLARGEWDDALALYEERAGDLVALDESLQRLEALDAEAAKVVELRFFGGLAMPEVAAAVGLSERTVERRWRMARAWLKKDLGG
ncbi:MAG: sigma-70 family RNA polymerase sigma factor [Planctomycetes bacterium]|nr:sigma-70 family RNA polymerase sigma factor [Planctomycetota bacterium]